MWLPLLFSRAFRFPCDILLLWRRIRLELKFGDWKLVLLFAPADPGCGSRRGAAGTEGSAAWWRWRSSSRRRPGSCPPRSAGRPASWSAPRGRPRAGRSWRPSWWRTMPPAAAPARPPSWPHPSPWLSTDTAPHWERGRRGNLGRSKRLGRPLTFFANRGLFVLALVIPLPVSEVAGVYGHGGFDLQLRQLHAVVEDPEELLGFFVFCEAAEERMLDKQRPKKRRSMITNDINNKFLFNFKTLSNSLSLHHFLN